MACDAFLILRATNPRLALLVIAVVFAILNAVHDGQPSAGYAG